MTNTLSRRLLIAAGVFAIAFTIACRGLIRRNTGARATPSVSFKILSYNLHGYLGNTHGSALTVAFLKETSSDILFLQEFSTHYERALAPLLGRYAFRASSAAHGYAVYSKHPLRAVTYLSGPGRYPLAQCGSLSIEGRAVGFCNAHLLSPAPILRFRWRVSKDYGHNIETRRSQWAAIIRWREANSAAIPFIAAGDLNTYSGGSLYATMTQDLADAMYEARFFAQGTYPAADHWFPLAILRIDYILVSSHLYVEDASTLSEGGSDHYPVTATLRL